VLGHVKRGAGSGVDLMNVWKLYGLDKMLVEMGEEKQRVSEGRVCWKSVLRLKLAEETID
jgi:hypothetical protein